MALIKCPECGREISDKAVNCPGCGAPVKVKKEGEDTYSNGYGEYQPTPQQQEALQKRQQINYQAQPVVTPYKNKDKIAGQTSRLVIGIISCCLFFVIMLQSCAVGVSNALVNEGESSGTFGFLLSMVFLISGIISMVMRKKESKVSYILPICFYTGGSLLSAVGAGTYSDLFIWCSLGILFASIILFNYLNSVEAVKAVSIIVPIAFFIVFVAIVNLFKPSEDGVKKVNEPQKVEYSDREEVETEIEKTNEEEENNETGSEQAVSVETAFKKGETAELNGVQVTLTDYKESTGGDYNKPADGNVFLMVEFEIANNSDKELSISSVMSFDAYADDYALDFSFSALMEKEGNQLDGTIAAGKKLKGWIGWEVPTDYQNVEIHFTDNVWSDDKFVFLIEK